MFKQNILYCIPLALALFLLSACDDLQSRPISIGINPWPGYEFLYLAAHKGFYKDEGLDVKIIEYGSLSDVRRGFERGKLDAMAVTLIEVLQADNNSDRKPVVRLVADFSDGADVIVARSDIKNIKDLKGKRIGADTTSLPIFLLARALEKASLGLDDITLVPLEQTTMERDYVNGQIDVAVTYPPVSVRLLKREDSQSIFTSKDIPGEIVDVLAFDESVLRSRPDIQSKIIKAWDRALQYANQNPDDAISIMAKREGITPDEFKDTLSGLVTVSGEKQQENYKKLPMVMQKLRQVLIKTGALPANVNEKCCLTEIAP